VSYEFIFGFVLEGITKLIIDKSKWRM